MSLRIPIVLHSGSSVSSSSVFGEARRLGLGMRSGTSVAGEVTVTQTARGHPGRQENELKVRAHV